MEPQNKLLPYTYKRLKQIVGIHTAYHIEMEKNNYKNIFNFREVQSSEINNDQKIEKVLAQKKIVITKSRIYTYIDEQNTACYCSIKDAEHRHDQENTLIDPLRFSKCIINHLNKDLTHTRDWSYHESESELCNLIKYVRVNKDYQTKIKHSLLSYYLGKYSLWFSIGFTSLIYYLHYCKKVSKKFVFCFGSISLLTGWYIYKKHANNTTNKAYRSYQNFIVSFLKQNPNITQAPESSTSSTLFDPFDTVDNLSQALMRIQYFEKEYTVINPLKKS